MRAGNSKNEGIKTKAQAKFLGLVHITSNMRAANDLVQLHFSAVLPDPSLIKLKRRDMPNFMD